MIDPLEATLAFLKLDTPLMDLVQHRIATKFQSSWGKEQAALVVRPDGGAVDVDLPHQTLGLDTRCYAASQYEAAKIWLRLVEISRTTSRTVVSTSHGDAIVYSFVQAGALALLWDADRVRDFAFGLFTINVSENSPL